MARLYLDAAPVIYYLEQREPLAAAVRRRLAIPGLEVAASHLTRLECRVAPLRDRDTVRTDQFDRFFAEPTLRMVEFTADVFDEATRIRAAYGFATADALHLAAALAGSCDAFLTNDHRLQRFPGIAIEIVG